MADVQLIGQKRLLDIAGAAEYLHIPERTIRRYVAERRIPHLRIGPRRLWFDPAQLDAWIASCEVAAEPDRIAL